MLRPLRSCSSRTNSMSAKDTRFPSISTLAIGGNVDASPVSNSGSACCPSKVATASSTRSAVSPAKSTRSVGFASRAVRANSANSEALAARASGGSARSVPISIDAGGIDWAPCPLVGGSWLGEPSFGRNADPYNGNSDPSSTAGVAIWRAEPTDGFGIAGNGTRRRCRPGRMGRIVESVDVPDDLLRGGDNQREVSTHGGADGVEDKDVIGVGDGNHRDPGLRFDGDHMEA